MKSNDRMGSIHPMNFGALDLNLVRVLDALLKERSVTRAGDRIGLSQPAVSAALNRLRHALGDQLFIRVGNDMVPTPRAEDLRDPVRQALALLEAAFGSGGGFEPQAIDRTFTLLGADFFATELAPALSRELALLAPQARLRMLDSARGDVGRLLLEDVIDIAVERPLPQAEWMVSEVLFRSPFAVIARPDEPLIAAAGLAPADTMPVELFCALPHALRSIDGSLSGAPDFARGARGRSRRVARAVPHFHAVALAVAEGGIVAVVPCQFAERVAPTLKLGIYRPPIAISVPNLSLYWHLRHNEAAEHRWLRALIAAVVRRLGYDRAADRWMPAN